MLTCYYYIKYFLVIFVWLMSNFCVPMILVMFSIVFLSLLDVIDLVGKNLGSVNISYIGDHL